MRSKLLDYFRPGKDLRSAAFVPDDRDIEMAEAAATAVPAAAPATAPDAAPAPAPATALAATSTAVAPPPQSAPHKGPLDYPSVKNWLLVCEEDFERGRDKHEYSALLPMFTENGCTRIDDIARLSADTIRSLAEKAGLNVSVGLANRVQQYAVEDVARVKLEGKLAL